MDATLARLCDEVQARLRSEMVEGADDPEFTRRIAVEILAGLDQLPEGKRRLDQDLLNSKVVYAVPDNALALVPAFVKAAGALFTGGPVTAISELVELLVRYEQLKVKLSVEEAAVLRVLKAAARAGDGALSLSEIGARLSTDGATVESRGILQKLKAKSTSSTTLVVEAGPRWAIGNV
jgi:hypothetical protein